MPNFYPKFTISSDILHNVSQCEVAKAIIENSPLVPAWERKFQSQALVRSVHHSTALEGNELTIDETERIIDGERVDTYRVRDVQEIINYRNVIGFISDNKSTEFTIGFLLKMHDVLGRKILPDKYLGKFRDRNAMIINDKDLDVVFDPPKFNEVEGQIEALTKWDLDEGSKIHPLLRAGIIHYEVVRIHPFADLNGRTARTLATWSLYRDGYDIKSFFSLEEHYDQDPKGYYDALDSANKGDMTEWLTYFTNGMMVELNKIKDKVWELSKDRRLRLKVGQVALNERQLEIINTLESEGAISNPDFDELFPKVSDDTILRDLKDLIEKGIVMKKGRTKGAKYYLA
ncbi:MAG TPA: Fic family protein [Candidatus Dojkabacteria bacterium]|jgi:Fic family protein|nr:Fic family protein [Candidatus Dojkabacteria bacterium]